MLHILRFKIRHYASVIYCERRIVSLPRNRYQNAKQRKCKFVLLVILLSTTSVETVFSFVLFCVMIVYVCFCSCFVFCCLFFGFSFCFVLSCFVFCCLFLCFFFFFLLLFLSLFLFCFCFCFCFLFFVLLTNISLLDPNFY